MGRRRRGAQELSGSPARSLQPGRAVLGAGLLALLLELGAQCPALAPHALKGPGAGRPPPPALPPATGAWAAARGGGEAAWRSWDAGQGRTGRSGSAGAVVPLRGAVFREYEAPRERSLVGVASKPPLCAPLMHWGNASRASSVSQTPGILNSFPQVMVHLHDYSA